MTGHIASLNGYVMCVMTGRVTGMAGHWADPIHGSDGLSLHVAQPPFRSHDLHVALSKQC
ncbi:MULTISPECIES: hypothetical protein [unclassified Streptosporangium]|uniref:hypothetical protein n=1 Tax=unclassified Streptosporangium TaxID=2632669 RepID=UPI002E2B52D4|nr:MULTISPECIES: hypothetical protein [unclassified Streptosporangium]